MGCQTLVLSHQWLLCLLTSETFVCVQAKFMQWIVNEIPDQSLLNTAGWRFIVPQLYKKYPNDDMNLNISLSSPPVTRISSNDIDATVYADLIIDVLEADDVIPVACISLVSVLTRKERIICLKTICICSFYSSTMFLIIVLVCS